MSLVTAAPSYPTSERINRRSILTRFGRETGLMQTGTATGGDNNYLNDSTRLQSLQFSPDDWVGAFLRISYDAGGAGAAPEGETRSVTSGEPGAGRLYVSPSFTAAPAAGDVYQLWRRPHPQDVLDHLDTILQQEAWLPCWQLLTECPDGDMEQPGTSDWTASNATISKVSSEPAMNGSRWLSVATTSGSGHAKSATLRVIPGKTYYLSALSRCGASGTTAQLTLWDEVNATAIETISHTQLANVRPWKRFRIPADCTAVTIRIGSSESGKTTYWDDVCFYGIEDYSISLPWWMKNPTQLKGVFRLRPEAVGDSLLSSSMRGEPDNRWDLQDSAFGMTRMQLVGRRGYMDEPLFILGSRNETAFTSENSDYKPVDANFINAALCFKVFNQLCSMPQQGSLDMTWVKAQREEWRVELDRQKRKQEVRLEMLIRSEAPDAMFWRNRRHESRERWIVN